MKKIIMGLLLISLVSCNFSEGKKQLIPYASLYDRFETEKYETPYEDHSKASYGYTANDQQGHLDWYYGKYQESRFIYVNYDEKSAAFKDKTITLKGALMKGNNACRKYITQTEGVIFITGKIIAKKDNSSLKIIHNDIIVDEKNNLLKSDMGVYLQLRLTVTKGDEIYFVSNGEIELNPMISYNSLKETPIHYDSSKDTSYPIVGDLHPYYENGELKNYYLSTNGKYTADMAISKDMVIFNDTDCKASSINPPYSEGFATRVVKIDGMYYSFYGAYDRFEATKSNDGLEFENAVKLNESLEVEYSARIDERYIFARDPYAFFDEDIGKWRIISLNYSSISKNNSPWDVDLALYTATSNGIKQFSTNALPLLSFKNTKNDPEVPQMMKINNRWYIFAAIYGRSVHGVGPLSYWIGDENAPIDKVDWSSKKEHILTGEDLCAAQIVEVGGQYYLYGWIPKDYNGQTWGGTINLPQEVYAIENGKLRVRLDTYLKQKLSKGLINSLYDDLNFKLGSTIKVEEGYKVVSVEDNRAEFKILSSKLNRSFIQMRANNIPSGGNVGIQLIQGNDVIEIRYNGMNHTITVNKKGVAMTYSKFVIYEDISKLEIDVIVENNILEVFVNNSYALCARIDIILDSYEVGVSANKVDTVFTKLNVYKLASKENFQDD